MLHNNNNYNSNNNNNNNNNSNNNNKKGGIRANHCKNLRRLLIPVRGKEMTRQGLKGNPSFCVVLLSLQFYSSDHAPKSKVSSKQRAIVLMR